MITTDIDSFWQWFIYIWSCHSRYFRYRFKYHLKQNYNGEYCHPFLCRSGMRLTDSCKMQFRRMVSLHCFWVARGRRLVNLIGVLLPDLVKVIAAFLSNKNQRIRRTFFRFVGVDVKQNLWVNAIVKHLSLVWWTCGRRNVNGNCGEEECELCGRRFFKSFRRNHD